MSNSILWKDSSINAYNLFVIVSTMILLLLTPLIPLAFWRLETVKMYIILFYITNGSIFLFILSQLLYEKGRWLYFNQHGIVIRWQPETGPDYEMFGWHHLKRINILDSWSPKSYLRWKRIKNNMSYSLFFASALYNYMLILETKKDKIYFVGINDYDKFFRILSETKHRNQYLKDLPIMNLSAHRFNYI